MQPRVTAILIAGLVALGVGAAGCGGDDGEDGGAATAEELRACLEEQGLPYGELAGQGAEGATDEITVPLGPDTRDDIFITYFSSAENASANAGAPAGSGLVVELIDGTVLLEHVPFDNERDLAIVRNCIGA